jgi:hypothetical protein
MDSWERPLLALLTLATFGAVLVVAWRRRRLGTAFAGITVILACAWGLAKIAVEHDYRDADGYVDCWPSCSHVQDTVGVGILFTPIVWILLGVLAAVLAALTGPRGREWKPLRGHGADGDR